MNREPEASWDVLQVRSDTEMGPILALTFTYSTHSDEPFSILEKSCVRLYCTLVLLLAASHPCPSSHRVELGEGSLPGWYPVVVS